MGKHQKDHAVTSRVYINIEADSADDARMEMQRLLGTPQVVKLTADEIEEIQQVVANGPGPVIETTPTTSGDDQPTAKATRERGKPSPGKARRTKEEIAEDDAADQADAALKTAGEETGAVVPDKHVDVVEDDAETAAADAADEAAETAGTEKPPIEQLRDVLGLYGQVYGLPAVMADGPAILATVVEGAKKVSDIPADKIAEAVAAVKAAGKANTYGRTPVEQKAA